MLYSPGSFVFHSLFSSSGLAHRSSLGTLVNQSTTLLMLSIGAIIMALAVLIFFHENANATKGYRLRNLERERSKLLMEEEVLNMEVAQSQALEKLSNDRQVKAMVPVFRPLYARPDGTVAKEL